MQLARQQVDDALLGLLSPLKPFGKAWNIASKHWQDWSNTSNQPALYLKRVKESATQQMRGQNKYVLMYEVWVYFQVDNNPNTDPYDVYVNPLMDMLDTAINPPGGSDYQSLGLPNGVANARWNGTADICDGSLDGQGIIVIPVHVWCSA